MSSFVVRDVDVVRVVSAVSSLLGCEPSPTVRRRGPSWVGVELDGSAWLRVRTGPRAWSAGAAELFAATAAGSAVVQPLLPHPVACGDVVATVWELASAPGPVSYGQLGSVLSELHRRSPTGPPCPLVADLRRSVVAASAAGLCTEAEADHLFDVACMARSELLADGGELGWGVVHHDATPANVVSGPDGHRLVDLEACGVGLKVCDFAPIAVDVARFGADPALFDETLDGYRAGGGGAPAGEALQAAVRLYEAWVVGRSLLDAAESPDLADVQEARLRVDTLCHGRDHQWSRR